MEWTLILLLVVFHLAISICIGSWLGGEQFKKHRQDVWGLHDGLHFTTKYKYPLWVTSVMAIYSILAYILLSVPISTGLGWIFSMSPIQVYSAAWPLISDAAGWIAILGMLTVFIGMVMLLLLYVVRI